MSRVFRAAVIAALLAAPCLTFLTGCGNKEEGKPNPELKVPDVPASGSGAGKGDMTKDKKK